jgi:1-acyl-sn-glycerol-3-phosphate acyltransferase
MPSRFDAAFSEALIRATLVQGTRAFWRTKIVPTEGGAMHFPPEAPCFVYGNHSNRYDPFFLNGYMPWGGTTRGVMTMEQFRGGFVSYLMRSIGLIPTRKAVPEPGVVRQLFKMVRDGHRVTVYPEHGCRWAGRPQPWIEATAKLFQRGGVPVYPVVTHGSYVSWPRWATYPRPGKIEIEVKAPLYFDRKQPFEEVLAQLKAAIDIDENVAPEHLRPKRAYRPADGIHRLLYRDPETGEWDSVYTPDGTHVRSRTSSIRWKMLPDSRLRDERTGTILLTGDLLERVRAFPLEAGPGGAVLTSVAQAHEEQDDLTWKPLGHVHAALTPTHVDLRGDTFAERIPLEAVRYAGVEQNAKLQLMLGGKDELGGYEGRVVQLTFGEAGSSPLAWYDAIPRLKGAQQNETNLAETPGEARGA